MRQYLDLLLDIKENGEESPDRTGTGTYSLFGRQLRFDLREGFPALTTKKLHFKSIIHELLWFLKGDTNIKYLADNGVKIWNEWADNEGELGPVYGKQWRAWTSSDGEEIDQIEESIKLLREEPHSRRNIVSAWNVADLEKMALHPCHCLFQFHVSGDGKYLDSQLYQRSADVFLGVPFNIASYSILTSMVAQVTGLEPREFVHTFGDVHLYKNHVEQADIQLGRNPHSLPTLWLNPEVKEIDSFTYEDIKIRDYEPDPPIKAEVSV